MGSLLPIIDLSNLQMECLQDWAIKKSIIGLLEVLTNPSKSISHEKNYVFILSTQKLQSIKPFWL